jgi:hypothetical protein
MEEWVDARGRTLYLEANGLQLVAIRCPEETACQAAAGKLPAGTWPALVRGRKPRLRLPDPGWAFLEGKDNRAAAPDLGATLAAWTVPEADPATAPLVEAARTLGRLIALETGGLEDLRIGERRVGWIPVACLDARIGPRGGDRLRAMVFPGPQGVHALVVRAPHRTFPRAAACLDKVLPMGLPHLPVAAPAR